MAYYIFIEENKINGGGQCKCLNENIYSADVPKELYEDCLANPLKYIVGEKEIEIDVPEFETVTEEYQEQVTDEEGNPVFDEEGNPVMETKTREVQKPIMIEVEETITVIDYDEEGNPIGEHEEIVTKEVQKTHIETVTIPYPVLNPNYDEEMAAIREAEFNKQFFNTSLGYIRRSVTMADGSHKDFLSDLLPVISASIQLGQTVNLITYEEPPFSEDITDWTPYQHIVQATPQFIQECFIQLGNDFLPINEE